ncbi:MAG: outer membrane beta-barrel domain-containing protein [Bdellovibrionales bacterium]|nr:outer membrane beta-barrel domain-containing protein [Bdellovibrionales bacterium]
MKTLKVLTLSTLLLASLSVAAAPKTTKKTAPAPQQQQAKQIDFNKDVDGLGGNDALMEMSERLNPETKSRIVQDRIVDRHNRLEVGINYGGVMGGTTYVQTQNIGATLDFHLTPRWSIGARYYSYQNQETPEGKRIYDEALANKNNGLSSTIVDIDRPQNATMGTINWYPVYGKINFFDKAIAQFDFYLLAGGGQIVLESGPTGIATAGLGFGLWMTKHVSARAEIRYQAYKDQIVTGSRDINSAAATIGLGWIL